MAIGGVFEFDSFVHIYSSPGRQAGRGDVWKSCDICWMHGAKFLKGLAACNVACVGCAYCIMWLAVVWTRLTCLRSWELVSGKCVPVAVTQWLRIFCSLNTFVSADVVWTICIGLCLKHGSRKFGTIYQWHKSFHMIQRKKKLTKLGNLIVSMRGYCIKNMHWHWKATSVGFFPGFWTITKVT